MPNEKSQAAVRELDIGKLGRLLLKRLWCIALCAAIGAAGMLARTVFLTPDTYTASATVYVYTNNPNQVNYQYTDQSALNTATRLMETYMVVIRSNKVMEAVAARLGYRYDPALIAQSLSVSSVAGTEVMAISATTGDPQLSYDICNAVAEFAPGEIIRVVNAGMVEVIDYASFPDEPDDKGTVQKGLIGAAAGVFLACAVIAVAFLLDKKIHTVRDLSEGFGLETLAAIPVPPRKGGKGADRFIISERMRPDIVEIFRMLRTSIHVTLGGADERVLLVSSAVPSEGKSTVSANLAIVTAQDSRRVLLIDADMRKPSQARLLNAKQDCDGLSGVLSGACSFDQAVQRDVRPRLDLLSSGELPNHPTELLNSVAMRRLMDRLRREYDWIILDTPPMNLVADALVLTGQVAGALMVTRRNISNLVEVRHALHTADQLGLRILGFVMTGVKGKQVNRSYKRSMYYKVYSAGYRIEPPQIVQPVPYPQDWAEQQAAQDEGPSMKRTSR